MPLTRGRYPVTNPIDSLLGQTRNVLNPSQPAYSNLYLAGGITALTDGTVSTSRVATSVAVPVDQGAVISKVSLFVGATASATITNEWAALYSGIAVPALIGQSTSVTTAMAASGIFTFTLTAPQLITPANAPNGFIYVSLNEFATTQATAAVFTSATAVLYAWYTGAPLFICATHGSSLGATAPATIVTPTAQATAPIVVLT